MGAGAITPIDEDSHPWIQKSSERSRRWEVKLRMRAAMPTNLTLNPDVKPDGRAGGAAVKIEAREIRWMTAAVAVRDNFYKKVELFLLAYASWHARRFCV